MFWQVPKGIPHVYCYDTYAGWPRTLENRENRENDEKKIPCVEKSGNLIKLRKSGKYQGILQLLFQKVAY